ncbi:MAG: ComE operon protein 1 [Syntrophaceae bacterium PtaU1.Bin231]|nr:MAG: ComE operon protein 1 [Syntrophaceae bacterium PtaU1.Bin231]
MRRFTMPSNWTNAESVPLCGQEVGAIGLFGVLLSAWLAAALFPFPVERERPILLPYAEWRAGAKVVELSGQREKDGIYHVPASATIGDILGIAGIDQGRSPVENADRQPPNGTRLHVSGAGGSFLGVQIGDMAAGAKLLFDVPLDINRARADELMLLEGIGPKTAEAITAYRSAHGAFRSVDDLTAIRGFKDRKLEKIRKSITVGGR